MDTVLDILKKIGRFPLEHKWKLLSIPILVVLWTIIIFPYGDLRGLAVGQLPKFLPGTTLDFQDISLGLGSPLALNLTDVEFETPGLPEIQIARLSASPSMSSLFTGLPGGTIDAHGIYEGSLHIGLESSSKSAKENTPATTEHRIAGSINDIQATSLTSALKQVGLLNLTATGVLSSNFDISIDPSFQTEPRGDLSLSGQKIEIPTISIPVPGMGSIQIPSLSFQKLDFKGALQDSIFNIENLTLGQSSDGISGQARGKLNLNLQNAGGRISALVSNIDLTIDLGVSDKISNSFLGQALNMMVEKYKQKSSTSTLSQYRFRLRIPQIGANPQFSEAQ